MDIDLRSAQECVDWFITEMRFYNIPPIEVAFLTDSTEEDCDVLIWEPMYRAAALYDLSLPRPYRPAKLLNHVTVEGWVVEFGPEAAYVVTPDGELFWRFQPGHLATATKPMRPVSAVPLAGNYDSALIHTLGRCCSSARAVQWPQANPQGAPTTRRIPRHRHTFCGSGLIDGSDLPTGITPDVVRGTAPTTMLMNTGSGSKKASEKVCVRSRRLHLPVRAAQTRSRAPVRRRSMKTIAVIAGALLDVAGVLLIVYGVRSILRWMKVLESSAIFESSFLSGPRPFIIPADGTYDIWIKVPRFRLNALAGWVPEIRGANGGPPVRLTGSLFRLNMMRGSVATMKVATFSASRGTYILGLVPAGGATQYAGISGLVAPFERMLGRAMASMSWPKADPAQCFLQVRDARSTSMGWFLKGVLPILLGAMLTGVGSVAGALGLAYANDNVVLAEGTGCSSGSSTDFTRSLAAAAAGSLSKVETGLGVRLEPVGDESPGADGESRAQPLPGSAYTYRLVSVSILP